MTPRAFLPSGAASPPCVQVRPSKTFLFYIRVVQQKEYFVKIGKNLKQPEECLIFNANTSKRTAPFLMSNIFIFAEDRVACSLVDRTNATSPLFFVAFLVNYKNRARFLKPVQKLHIFGRFSKKQKITFQKN